MTSLMSCWPRAGWVPDSALGRFWGSSCPRIFFIAFALAVPVAALSVLLGWVIASAIPPQGESKLPDPAYMLIAVSLSPIVENWVVLRLGDVIPDRWARGRWWIKPLLIAVPAGLFHVLVNWNLVSLTAIPTFFVIACLAINVRSRRCGYWASVILHALVNALLLGLWWIAG